MNEKEKKLAEDIMEIFDRLPESQQHRLVGVAEGMDIASSALAKDDRPESEQPEK